MDKFFKNRLVNLSEATFAKRISDIKVDQVKIGKLGGYQFKILDSDKNYKNVSYNDLVKILEERSKNKKPKKATLERVKKLENTKNQAFKGKSFRKFLTNLYEFFTKIIFNREKHLDKIECSEEPKHPSIPKPAPIPKPVPEPESEPSSDSGSFSGLDSSSGSESSLQSGSSLGPVSTQHGASPAKLTEEELNVFSSQFMEQATNKDTPLGKRWNSIRQNPSYTNDKQRFKALLKDEKLHPKTKKDFVEMLCIAFAPRIKPIKGGGGYGASIINDVYTFTASDELAENGIVKVFNTYGEGSCGLHAMFGEDKGDQFKYDEVVSLRKKLANTVKRHFNDDEITDPNLEEIIDLAQNGIELLYNNMEAGDTPNSFRKAVIKVYQPIKDKKKEWDKELAEINDKMEKLKNNVEKTQVRKKKLLLSGANNKVKIKKLEQRLEKANNVYAKQEIQRKEIVQQLDKLNDSFIYHPDVLKAYVTYLQDRGQYLLQDEIRMFALLEDITVRMFQPGWGHDQDKLGVMIINPGKTNSVDIFYNGYSHYEKAEFEV